MKKLAFLSGVTSVGAAFTAMTSTVAFACIPDPNIPGGGCPTQPVPVPEISALEGTAAIAALAAIVLLTWERRRRAA